MKYSLDLTNPWISRYYHNNNDGQTKQSNLTGRDLYRMWLDEEDNEVIRMFSSSEKFNALKRLGYNFL